MAKTGNKVRGEFAMKSLVRDRAIAAFKKAHPSCPHGIRAFKNRARQIVRVYGYEDPECQHGARLTWSYSNNGRLERITR